MVIETTLWVTALLFLFLASAELGMLQLRHVVMERALDLTMRDVRLGTGRTPQYNDLKTMICDRAWYVPDCENALKIEMRRQSMLTPVTLPARADCVNRAEEVRPARSYEQGAQNEFMVLRICAKFQPFFGSSSLASSLPRDSNGDYALVSTGAFVQEPN